MPAISTTDNRAQQPKPKKVKVKRPKTPKVRVTVPDAKESTRTTRPHTVTPDQADRLRGVAQKAKDAATVKQNVQTSQTKVAVKRERARHQAFLENALKNPHSDARTAAIQAPVLKVLDQTTRPLHAIAGAVDATINRPNLPGSHSASKAAIRGLENKDKTTFSDVLKHAGVKNKAIRGVAGFTLDVGLDPTTYLTGGTGSIAEKGAVKAATKAEKATAAAAKKATPKVVTRAATVKEGARAAARAAGGGAEAPSLAERAHARALKTGDQTTGVRVKVAGKEIPGVRKATAHASKPVRKAAGKVTPKKARSGARAVGADLNPDVAPVGVSKETSAKAVQATRTARAKSSRGAHEADQQGIGIRKAVGEKNYSLIIDAIENKTIGQLPVELRDAAVKVRSHFRHANRLRKTAGIRGGEVGARIKAGAPAQPESFLHGIARAKSEPGDVPKGHVRLYRGQGTHQSTSSGEWDDAPADLSGDSHGRWFTDSLDRARGYSDGGMGLAGFVTYVDVPKGVAEKAFHSNTKNGKTFVLPEEYARATEHDVGGIQRAQADAAERARNAATADDLKIRRAIARAAVTGEPIPKRIRDLIAQREADAAASKAKPKVKVKTHTGNVKAYIPHHLTEQGQEELGHTTAGGVGRKVIRTSASKARQAERAAPLSELRTNFPGQYSEDLPNLYASHRAEGSTAVARAELNRRIADLGQDVRKGKNVTLAQGESVYHIVGSDIRKVDEKEVAKVIDQGGVKGRYVVLHDDIVKRAIEGSQPALQGPGIVRGLDKAQGGFKRLALATPGFHIRNIIGDTQNAYLGQAGHHIPKNMVDAGRVLKAEGRRDQAHRGLSKPTAGKGKLKTSRYGNVTYEYAAEQLAKHGAMRSGYTARELPELSKGRVVAKMPRKVKAALLNREDLPRLTTAIEALKHGATWEQAAQKVADYHFDYGHLTHFERQIARRAAPFYTFTARNIPLQAKSLVTKPGKYATYQKVREEATKATQPEQQDPQTQAYYKQLEAAGVKLPGGWEKYLSEYEQRNAGVPVKWKGQNFTVSAGLPLNDLSELPGFAGGVTGQAREYYNKAASLVTPILKDPVEFGANYSFFFRNQIEQDNSPLVSAPAFVAKFPESEKKRLGVVQGKDKRSGKTVWKWPGKVDYIAHTPPGLANMALKLATPGADRQGRGLGGKALQVAGIRSQPIDARSNAVNLAYARQVEIQKRQSALRETNNPKNGLLISAKNPTPEYLKLTAQLKLVQRVAYQAKLARGDATLPTVGGPPKGRSSTKVHLGGSTSKVHLGGSGGVKIRLGGG